MYSSLDRADIEVKNPSEDGRRMFVQTDHRTTDEIQEQPELSTIFALIRILNPKQIVEDGSPEPIVIYSAQERPPEFLQRVIYAAGGQLTLGGINETEAFNGEPAPLIEVVESAFTNLARSIANEYQVSLTLEGLETVESKLAEVAGDPEENEIAYWSAVVKLGCFGGELIRSSIGGNWVVADGALAFALSLQFANGDEVMTYPLDKAIKRFSNGVEDTLVYLAEVLFRHHIERIAL
jgi:hypothetical protein